MHGRTWLYCGHLMLALKSPLLGGAQCHLITPVVPPLGFSIHFPLSWWADSLVSPRPAFLVIARVPAGTSSFTGTAPSRTSAHSTPAPKAPDSFSRGCRGQASDNRYWKFLAWRYRRGCFLNIATPCISYIPVTGQEYH